ncbi:alpha-(1,3)-fucosyltransferase 10-like [Pectinophora gossypiella]|uniref:alpha-(1,3)-fucosyltransferase 10-like n=1 Tax=Pectinophora gossypiella TaxID=13191 RepID=UPI00214EDB25|nr:alpha-(1,3)-fucosyltransferase 10-like [Pectinophora gossypiella]
MLEENQKPCKPKTAEKKNPDNPKAYLFYGSAIDKIPLPRDPKTLWGLLHYESPTNTLVLMHEKALNLFNFSATFSRFSDVPFPLIWMGDLESIITPMYFVNTSTKNSLLTELAPILFLQSDSFTSTQRDDYVDQLMKYIKVDSYGASLHNKELPLDNMYSNKKAESNLYLYHLYGDELCNFIARYKFIITIENGVCNDYMTEKIWRAIEVGVVPIYYGSPLIRDWLPNNKSAILLEDFPTPELLSQHLHYLLNNDTAYEEYLVHKTQGIISNQKLIDELTVRPYQLKLDEVVKEFECFVCEKIHNNNSDANIVTKNHYNCPMPRSAITLTENVNNSWVPYIADAMERVNRMYEEIEDGDLTPRKSKTSWW